MVKFGSRTQEELQKLVGDGSEEADRHQKIGLLLVDAPEQQQDSCQKNGFASQLCDDLHDRVEKRGSQIFKKIQKLHGIPPFV